MSRPTRIRGAPVNATNALPDAAGHRLVDLVGIHASDVVRLEDRVEVSRHGLSLPRRRRRPITMIPMTAPMPTSVPQAPDPFRRRCSVVQRHVVARRDHHHEVRGRSVRPGRALRLPVREERRLDVDRHARARDMERDGVVGLVDVRDAHLRKRLLARVEGGARPVVLPRARSFGDQRAVERGEIIEPRHADAVLPLVDLEIVAGHALRRSRCSQAFSSAAESSSTTTGWYFSGATVGAFATR